MTAAATELEVQVLSVPDQAKLITIKTPADYAAAGEFLVRLKGLRKQIDDTFDPIITKAHSAHKEAVAQKKKVEGPLAIGEGHIKGLMTDFRNEAERIRREQEAAARAEATRKAEEEQLAKAEAAEKRGDTAKAEAILNQPLKVVPMPVKPSETPTVAGVSFRQNWKARVIDETLIPREYLMVDMSALNGIARSMKGKAVVPGVEFYPEDVVAAGAGS